MFRIHNSDTEVPEELIIITIHYSFSRPIRRSAVEWFVNAAMFQPQCWKTSFSVPSSAENHTRTSPPKNQNGQRSFLILGFLLSLSSTMLTSIASYLPRGFVPSSTLHWGGNDELLPMGRYATIILLDAKELSNSKSYFVSAPTRRDNESVNDATRPLGRWASRPILQVSR